MTIQFHKDQQGHVRPNSDIRELIPSINHSAKQDCVLVRTLSSIFFSIMFKQATANLEAENGVNIRYRLDNSFSKPLAPSGAYN